MRAKLSMPFFSIICDLSVFVGHLFGDLVNIDEDPASLFWQATL